MGHTVLATQNRTCTTKQSKEKPLESTGVGPAKHSPKVKSEFVSLLLERYRGSINRTSICENVSPFIVVERWLFFLSSRSFQCGTIVGESWLFFLNSRSFQCGILIQTLQSVVGKDFPFWILGLFQAIGISDHGPILRLSAMGLQSAWDHLYTGQTVPIRQTH